MSDAPLYLIFDCETRSLKARDGAPLEVAYAVTDDLLKAADAPVHSHLIWTDVAAAVQAADPYVRQMHTDNGLWTDLEDVAAEKVLLADAEDNILAEIRRVSQGDHTRPVYLLGNSIRMDREFIEHWMTILDHRLHYRQLDLTSVNLLIQGLGGPDTKVAAESTHRAADDVRLTVRQLGRQAAIVQAHLEGGYVLPEEAL